MFLPLPAEGWAIPREDLDKKSLIGKGEFRGSVNCLVGIQTGVLI